MSYSVVPTANTTGVRRLQTLGAMWGLGASSDIVAGMIGEGYDPSVVNLLAAAQASDAQLQYLWDNYPAGSQEFAVAANQLLSNLTGGPGGAASAPGYPAAAQPKTISTGFGIFDLTQQAAWDAMAATIGNVQQLVQQAAATAPNAPDVVSNVGQFNSLVGQFASYYSQVTGKSLSPLPMASIPTLGTLGIFGIDDAIVLTIAGIIAAIYAIYQWASTRKSQAAATTAQAQSAAAATAAAAANASAAQQQASSLTSQANALLAQANSLAASNPTQAAAIRAQATTLQTQATQLVAGALTAVTPATPGAPTNWNVWLQQNFGLVLVGVAAIVIGPQLIKKL
jgi:cytochrome c-type biogenesis protein CcmH/NrfF